MRAFYQRIRKISLQAVMFAALLAAPAMAQDIESGLVGHWKLDETSGTTAVDSGSGGNDGTMTNGLNATNDSIPGKQGTALDFDGNDYIQVGDVNIIDGQPEASLCLWYNYRGTFPLTEREMLIAEWQSGYHGWYLLLSESNQSIAFTPSTLFGSTVDTGANSITPNKWTHVCATFLANTYTRIYVNGEMVVEDTTGIPASIHTDTLPLRIGSQQFGQQFNGRIDDVRVYTRTLSDEDVFALANSYIGSLPCNAAHEAVMLYNNAEKIMQYCNGTDWVDMGPKGTSSGYFVEIGLQANGDMGGIAGANATCLSELTTDPWLGKSDAQAQGLLTAANVRAWLCSSTSCNNLDSNKPYKYASTLFPSSGGLIMTATPEGYTENDGHAYSHSGVFGTGAFREYFTGRSQTNTIQANTCSDWASTSGTTNAAVSDTSYYPEKLSKYSVNCNTSRRLICIVDAASSTGACSSPAGKAGEVGYNFTEGVMQYCNGYSWINMGPKIANAGTEALTYTAPTATMVGHWTLDETSGSSIADSSGNGNTGTWSDNADNDVTGETVAGQNGTGLNFDGSDDYIDVGNDPSLQITGDQTWAAWIKGDTWNSGGTDDIFITKSTTTTSGLAYQFKGSEDCGSQRLVIQITSDGSYGSTDASRCSNTILATGTWYHVAAVYDASVPDLHVYVNGKLDDGSTINAVPASIHNSAANVTIGTTANNAFEFDGVIDDARIYNSALSAADIYSLYRSTGGTDNSLALHLPFDETSGTTASDTSGNGLNGTMQNGLDATNDSVAGVSGQALDFDGTDDVVSAGNDPLINDSSTLTYSGWFYPTVLSFNQRLFENGVTVLSQGNNGSLYMNFGRWSGGYAAWNTADNVLALNQWNHVVLTYDYSSTANDPALYINGLPVSLTETFAPSGTVNTTDYQLYIGNRSSGNRPWIGRIDDFRFYNRVLSATEAAILYANTGGGSIPVTGCPNIGDVCDDGTIYAGDLDYGSGTEKLFVAPTNQSTSLAWHVSGSNDGISSDSLIDGQTNHASLNEALTNYPAIEICENLNTSGHSDWYLPARDELLQLYANQAAIDTNATENFNLSGYWSSSEWTAGVTNLAWQVSFASGTAGNETKTNSRYVRCIRRGNSVTGGTCSSPRGVAGEMIYNDDNNIMQYCNGSEWVGIK